ncbi:MAG TPA: helix-turn-helix domain-containing protein [Lysobacter sp.]
MDAYRCFVTRHERDDALPAHRHRTAYAALVLDGMHVETSADGPFECTPGTLLLHPDFHAHGNRFGHRGAHVINLPLPGGGLGDTFRALRVAHLGDAKAVFERQPELLATLVAASSEHPTAALPDWQPAFLRELARTDAPIGRICRRLGVSPAHASRAVLRSHGLSPQALRRELRCRHALSLMRGAASLADIAAQSGFTDQSHLTRTVRSCTGLPPSALRRQIKYVQDRA